MDSSLSLNPVDFKVISYRFGVFVALLFITDGCFCNWVLLMRMSGIIVILQFINCFKFSCHIPLHFTHTHHLHSPCLPLSFSTLHFHLLRYCHWQSDPITSTWLSLNRYGMAHSVSYSPQRSVHKIHCHCTLHTNPLAHYISALAIEDCNLHKLCKRHPSCTNPSTCYIKITMASQTQSQSHTICLYNLPLCHSCRYHYRTLISIALNK